MKDFRQFLKGLELDTETIDTIVAEVGKNFTGLKENNDALRKEVEENKKTIQDLNKTIEENSESLKSLKDTKDENNSLKAEIKMKDSNVKKEFSKFVASEVQSLVKDNVDFEKALETYKKDNPQYFGDVQVKKVQTSPVLNGGEPKAPTTNDVMNDILRGAVSTTTD